MTEEQHQRKGGGQARSAEGPANGGAHANDGQSDATSVTPGTATDALVALGSALVKSAETKPANVADPNVSTAFALGWHMSELYDQHSPNKDREPADLPGLSELRKEQPLLLVVSQVVAGVNSLKDIVTRSGLDSIDLTELKALAPEKRGADAVLAIHDQLLAELTAADPCVGKAYGLGRALADSCHEPDGLDGLEKQLSPYRIANLLRWLDDLASALPPHAGHSVATSLGRWSQALYPPNNGRLQITWRVWRTWRSWRERRRRPNALNPADSGSVDEAVKALRRQGELWRVLLSGEKQGQDMLEMDNYLDAGKELACRTAMIVRRAIMKMPSLTIVIAALVGGGVWLLSNGHNGHLVAGATSIFAGLGLTWKGLGSALGQLAGKLEQPLWGAVLDDAIADAITLLPDNTAEAGGRRNVARLLAAGSAADDHRANEAFGS